MADRQSFSKDIDDALRGMYGVEPEQPPKQQWMPPEPWRQSSQAPDMDMEEPSSACPSLPPDAGRVALLLDWRIVHESGDFPQQSRKMINGRLVSDDCAAWLQAALDKGLRGEPSRVQLDANWYAWLDMSAAHIEYEADADRSWHVLLRAPLVRVEPLV